MSSMIANASRHFVPPKLSSWKLALYLIVFLLPGGSFVVLGMGWFENRHRRKAASATPRKAAARPLLTAPCSPCPGSGGASGA
ncbi:hypothetical protein [Caballeronia sp. J97]|uniref:hypothetical protein n=1 Tax=Caballeronia sp. J97 TaxID=2805429 RepID=UPI002AB29087|nr:hypothetical protein [Caballeronia sp. J97]